MGIQDIMCEMVWMQQKKKKDGAEKNLCARRSLNK